MKFGSEKSISFIDENGSTIGKKKVYRNGEVVNSFVEHKIRVKVADEKQETTEYLKWSDTIRLKRSNGSLHISSADPDTQPAFVIELPKHDIDGSYFVVHCWTEMG